MTDRLREAAQAALELLTGPMWGTSGYMDGDVYADAREIEKQLRAALDELEELDALTSTFVQLSAALAEQEAEPVAWYLPSPDGDDSIFRDHRTVIACTGNKWEGFVPLYTHPPRREWQGLTKEERRGILDTTHPDSRWTLVERVEAALRAKNDY